MCDGWIVLDPRGVELSCTFRLSRRFGLDCAVGRCIAFNIAAECTAVGGCVTFSAAKRWAVRLPVADSNVVRGRSVSRDVGIVQPGTERRSGSRHLGIVQRRLVIASRQLTEWGRLAFTAQLVGGGRVLSLAERHHVTGTERRSGSRHLRVAKRNDFPVTKRGCLEQRAAIPWCLRLCWIPLLRGWVELTIR